MTFDEQRTLKLTLGKVETWRTEDGRVIRLFYGPYSFFQAGGYVGKKGFAVDVEGNEYWSPVRNWYETLEAADAHVFQVRAKSAMDIARAAFELPVSNYPPEGE